MTSNNFWSPSLIVMPFITKALVFPWQNAWSPPLVIVKSFMDDPWAVFCSYLEARLSSDERVPAKQISQDPEWRHPPELQAIPRRRFLFEFQVRGPDPMRTQISQFRVWWDCKRSESAKDVTESGVSKAARLWNTRSPERWTQKNVIEY